MVATDANSRHLVTYFAISGKSLESQPSHHVRTAVQSSPVRQREMGIWRTTNASNEKVRSEL